MTVRFKEEVFRAMLMMGALVSLSACVADDLASSEASQDDALVPIEDEAFNGYWEQAPEDSGVVLKNISTVGQLVRNRGCSTGPSQPLNVQIADEINCIRDDLFENINDIPNLRFGAGANTFLQRNAAQSLRRVLARRPGSTMTLNSSWRSPVQQYILKRWEGSCGIGVAASPGRSNHESGLAIDIPLSFTSELRAEGWVWYCTRYNGGRSSGCRDIPHWDYTNGVDVRRLGVRAFQRLWNKANPGDRIAEDGLYGAQTAARIERAPISGFSTGTTCRSSREPAPQVPDDEDQRSDLTDVLDAFERDSQGRTTGTNASVWRPEAPLAACAQWSIGENYASGRFNVHRYRAPISGDGTLTVRVARTAGSWSPAIFLVDQRGSLLYAGDADAGNELGESTPVSDGRSGDVAEVRVDLRGMTSAFVYVTAWEIVDAALNGRVPRDARYTLSLAHDCGSVDDDTEGSYRGLSHNGLEIPRAGLSNNTLRGVHGVSTERYGEVITRDGQRFVRGRVSWFGGPNDSGVGSQETGAITGERLRSLNSPTNPSRDALSSRPEDFYYAAMRWNYNGQGARPWRNARVVVSNPDSGVSLVVRAVDWGPNINTARVIDLSPQALRELGLQTDDQALIAFVAEDTPLGPLR